MNWPKITIITPSYNQGEFIEETILSIINQNYPNLEYIIIDGGSTDNTVDIIKQYEAHIAYWVSEPDEGQSHAINKGLERATGDIINWLNSDDYYYPDALKRVAEHFADPSITCVGGRTRVFGPNTEFFVEGTFVGKNLQQTMCYTHIEQPATFFRKSAVDKMGMLSKDIHFVMDKEWWLKYIFHFGLDGVKKVEDIYINFRHHDDSKTIAASDKFYIDYATLLHSMAEQKELNGYMKLLGTKHKINVNFEFTCTAFDAIDKAQVERMIITYLLKRGGLIFTERDFNHAKQLLLQVDFSRFELDEKEQAWLQNIKTQVSGKTWLTFRVARKAKWVLGKK